MLPREAQGGKQFAKLRLPFPDGQVAQSVERSPEKAGVGGSIPSLATIPINQALAFGSTWTMGVHPGQQLTKSTFFAKAS